MKLLVPFCTLIVSAILLAGNTEEPQKINGMSFVAPVSEVDESVFDPLLTTGTNWIAVIPYGYFWPDNPKVIFDQPRQHWGETLNGSKKTIELARKSNLQVMLKPHVWVIGQGWAGDFEAENEIDWKLWEETYETYILANARLAQEMKVPLFCIGTEFRKAVVARQTYWESLINKVKEIYKGEITYAANWDNYEQVTFWDKLDYIGIDAYFPLSEELNPTVEALKASWMPSKIALEQFSERHQKRLLFTEFGFASRDYSAAGHWAHKPEAVSVNLEAQQKAFQATFESFWIEDWFAGGFIWKWHSDHKRVGGIDCKEFTPQNKPAQETIRAFFQSHRK